MTGNCLISLIKNTIILFGVLLLIDTIFMSFLINFNSGLLALGAFSIAIIVYGILWHKMNITKWIHVTAAFVFIVPILFSAFLVCYGKNDNAKYNEDAVIILGAGIRGEKVTFILAQRLNKAVEYYTKNPNAVFVVSGGQGKQETITEALAMERYLVDKGIPIEKIIKEEKSTSTFENFMFSNDILKQKFPQGFSTVFITNDFHVFRAERVAKKAGISACHMGSTIYWYAIPANCMREMMALIKFWALPPRLT